MLGTEQSTKWKPHPLLESASRVGLSFMFIFMTLAGVVYLKTMDKTFFYTAICFSIISMSPATLYFVESQRLDKEHKAFKASKSTKSVATQK